MKFLSPATCLLVPLLALGVLPEDHCPKKPKCSYAVVPVATPMRAAGGNTLVRVTTASSCTWTYAGNVPWITVDIDSDSTGPTGRGNGSVVLMVAPNPDVTRRTGTATIARQTITVDQAGTGGSGCTFDVSPAELTFTGGGAGTGEFTITASAPDCGWTASRASVLEDTVSLTAGGSGGGPDDRYGVGSSVIRYSVRAQSPTSPWPSGGGNITVTDAALQTAATHHVRFQ
jgi:hypothetical protein